MILLLAASFNDVEKYASEANLTTDMYFHQSTRDKIKDDIAHALRSKKITKVIFIVREKLFSNKGYYYSGWKHYLEQFDIQISTVGLKGDIDLASVQTMVHSLDYEEFDIKFNPEETI